MKDLFSDPIKVRIVFDNLPFGLAINIISTGRTVYINSAFEATYGWPREEIPDRETFFKLVYPVEEYRNQISSRIIADMESGDPARMRWENIMITPKSGKPRWVTAQNIPIYSNDLMISTVIDVTQQHLYERELEESQQKFVRLAENARDIIYRYEFKPERGFSYVSPASLSMTGYSPEDHYKDADLGFKLVHPDDLGLLESITENSRHPVRLRWNTRAGKTLWVEQNNVVILDDAGEPEAIEGIARDITRQVENEQRIERLLLEKETLMREVQHRVKNNVNTIYSLLNLQIEKEQNESAKKALLDAAARVQSMAVLINQLYSNGGVARLQSSREYFTTLAGLAISLFPESGRVQLNMNLEEILLPEKTLSALGMILNELITNSMKYAFNHVKPGYIQIVTRLVDQNLQLLYQDSGGEILPHTATTTQQPQGSGFGSQLIQLLLDQLKADGGYTGKAEPQFSISIALET